MSGNGITCPVVLRGYEHIIRDQVDYERIAAYILANLVNWDQDEENPDTITPLTN
jgi:hypothetical protein